MAKGQTVAIWIILVVVLAAAAGVIVIAVQNNKREQQLAPVESAATLYSQNASPKTGGATMGRPSMRANVKPQPRPQSAQTSREQKQQNKQEHQKQMQQQQQMPRGLPPHMQQQRYDTAMVSAHLAKGNQLPPTFVDSSYNNGVGMTTFAPLPGPSHAMSTTAPNYPPRSGGGALFIPSQSPQAEMPAQQMSVSHSFPSTLDSKLKLQDLSSISAVGGYSEKAAVGTSLSNFVGSAYFQDPATMTPNTYADGLGLDAYMPDVSNATPDGLDPQTGLPVFSTASLLRSNRLSSHGLNGYLRPQMDDSQGYKHTVGKRLQICRYNDCDLDKRRNQFNASRLNSGGEDPVLFNITDFMYLP